MLAFDAKFINAFFFGTLPRQAEAKRKEKKTEAKRKENKRPKLLYRALILFSTK